MIFQHYVMPKKILKKFEKSKNGKISIFLKFSSGYNSTQDELDICFIYEHYYWEIFFSQLSHLFFLFSVVCFFFVLGDTDKYFLII